MDAASEQITEDNRCYSAAEFRFLRLLKGRAEAAAKRSQLASTIESPPRAMVRMLNDRSDNFDVPLERT